MYKVFMLGCVSVLLLICMVACGGESGSTNIDGRYEAEGIDQFFIIQAILIEGDNFTIVCPPPMPAITAKYMLTDGTISFTDGTTTISYAFEYKNDSIWFEGVEYKRNEY